PVRSVRTRRAHLEPGERARAHAALRARQRLPSNQQRMTPDMKASHRAFLDRYYRLTHHVYDLSRKYFLFGRDGVLERLLASDWTTLVELGPGTGRNLAWLHRRRPKAMLGGLEASEVMRAHARRRCPWARIDPGFAEDANIGAVLGTPPQRI